MSDKAWNALVDEIIHDVPDIPDVHWGWFHSIRNVLWEHPEFLTAKATELRTKHGITGGLIGMTRLACELYREQQLEVEWLPWYVVLPGWGSHWFLRTEEHEFPVLDFGCDNQYGMSIPYGKGLRGKFGYPGKHLFAAHDIIKAELDKEGIDDNDDFKSINNPTLLQNNFAGSASSVVNWSPNVVYYDIASTTDGNWINIVPA